MSNEFEQYALSNYKKKALSTPTAANSDDDFEQYALENYKPKAKNAAVKPDENVEQLKKQHPLLFALAEKLHGTPGLEQAGNAADVFNKYTELSGLPSAAKGFLGTGVEMGRGIANLMPGVNIPQQQYPQLRINPHLGTGAEILGSLGMGIPAIGAYKAAKKGIETIPYATKVPELIRNLLAGGAVGAAVSPEHRKLGAGLGAGAELLPAGIEKAAEIYKNYSPKTKMKELLNAMMAEEREVGALTSAQNEAKDLFKIQDPRLLEQSAAGKEAELANQRAFQEHRIGEQQQLPGGQFPEELEHQLAHKNEEIKGFLGETEPHTENLSKHIVDAIEGKEVIEPHPETGLPRKVRKGGLREEVGEKYEKLAENLPDVEIPNKDFTHEIEKELEALTGNKSDLSEKEKESLKQLLVSSHPSKGKLSTTISGRKFFNAYRSLKRLEGQQRSKAYSGLSPEAHDEWIARANQTKSTQKEMEAIIGKHFPKDTLKKLHEINHEYSTKVAPLHENPAYQQMLKHGKYDANILKALSGTTKGNDILNNMIKNDPELARLVIGKEFSQKPETLLKPNTYLNRYVESNPTIKRLMLEQQQLHSGLEKAKEQVKLHEHVKDIPRLEREIPKQRKLADEIRTQLERRDLTKQERVKKQLELTEAERKSKQLSKRLLISVVGSTGAAYITKKMLD